MKEIYTIKRLCDELNEPRQRIRRRIESLDIEAINEHSRKHSNEPLKYDIEAYLILKKEFGIEEKNSTTDEVKCSTVDVHKEKLIEVLEQQLEESNKSRDNLEKLLDQQQQLTLLSNKENEVLKLELEKNKSIWKKIFR